MQSQRLNSFEITKLAQFLCAMSGGKIIQDMKHNNEISYPLKHNMINNYKVETFGNKVSTNSYHHQMMYPFNLMEEDYNLLAYTTDVKLSTKVSNLLTNGLEGHKLITDKFAEIVLFNNTNSLCIQGHPEYNDFPSMEYILNILNEFMYDTTEKYIFQEETKEEKKSKPVISFKAYYDDIIKINYDNLFNEEKELLKEEPNEEKDHFNE